MGWMVYVRVNVGGWRVGIQSVGQVDGIPDLELKPELAHDE